MSQKMTGTVKWYNPVKSFGFIKPDAGGQDVFVHASALQESRIDSLNENDRVEFELVNSRGKQSAGNLKKI